MIRWIVCLLAVLGSVLSAAAAQPKESPGAFAQRTAWWREARFGMFIHWGVYSVLADGEWVMNVRKMQVKDYEKYPPRFNPVDFDAREWVRIAKSAGMKYIVITSKHHDGFCMFDSKLTDYTITKATPFKRDPLKELAAACKEGGIKLCFYHSIMDWHHPDYLPRRDWEKGVRDAKDASLNRYIDHMKGQLTELLTNYGDIGVIWFDGGWEHNAKVLRSAEVVALIRKLQPNILINDRINLPEDFSTPEQTIPAGAMPNDRLWETCMTLNNNWGYSRNDHNWKSVEDLARKLIDIASKGGNFLLNVGPTEKGKIPSESVERLAAVGQWMKVNGESIYGTSKSPYRRTPFDGRCTVKGDTLYIHVFKWPAGGVVLTGLTSPVASIRFLDSKVGGDNVTLAGDTVTPEITIKRPAQPDPIATVVALKFPKGISIESTTIIKPDANGRLSLKAVDAEVHGGHAQYESGDARDNIGFWTDRNDYVTWPIEMPAGGDYLVEVTYACDKGTGDSTYTVGVGRARVPGKVAETGSWTTFKSESLGRLHVAAGKQTVTVKPTAMPHFAVMNLREAAPDAGQVIFRLDKVRGPSRARSVSDGEAHPSLTLRASEKNLKKSPWWIISIRA